MSNPRFYLPPEFWPANPVGGEVALPEEEAHHARDVMRLRAGDALRLFDGAGRTASACFSRASKREAWVMVESVETHPRPEPFLSIAYAPPKGKRASFAVEKLTELGADEIIPLKTSRSVSEGGSAEKWEARVIEAAKQCGRPWLPIVRETLSLEKIIPLVNPDGWDTALLASPEDPANSAVNTASVAQRLMELAGKSRRLLWLIGPEGGFSAAEEEALVTAGCQRFCLGQNILRIETAAELCAGLTRFLRQ